MIRGSKNISGFTFGQRITLNSGMEMIEPSDLTHANKLTVLFEKQEQETDWIIWSANTLKL